MTPAKAALFLRRKANWVANKVALIDYGAGNLHSVHNALKVVGAQVAVTSDANTVRAAERIVLPGVGSFKACADGLRSIPGMVEALSERVHVGGAPFLGICVGMQLLATRGLEHGETAGLGWIDGEVRLIEPSDPTVKIPHMGWNDVALMPHAKDHPVLEEGEAYFLHSYHFAADNPADIAALTDHGEGLVAAVARDNIIGVQFHPEKSQQYGLDMLTRFLEWKP
ncbi:MAG: imidazole glycerol phosphate synthase subunit HisH [Erythrobacter sp.]